ncbi:MAG: penicillin-binding transpeptidase domain-containing protein [Candidatus Paceibacterota bacterium]|jgi:penicillin-binding protein 2
MFSIRRKRARHYADLSPDEIFVDASNLPAYNEQQFEGRIERPIRRQTFLGLAIFCGLLVLIFGSKIFYLQVVNGADYAERSLNNSLSFTPIFAERGDIYDRRGQELAWTGGLATTTEGLAGRVYINQLGLGHLLGYVSYPNEEEMATGQYDPKEYLGRAGVEKVENDNLLGERGVQIIEVNAKGEKLSDHIVQKPVPGKEIKLSIDTRVQTKFYDLIKQLANDKGFTGGSGVIMDVQTGEILALASYPDFDPNILSTGQDAQTISRYFSDSSHIMLNRAVSGLYTPGSIFKPFVALGALTEKTIDPRKTFVTNGELVVPNPYDKTQETVFKDWKNNGTVDLRRAIAVSSNVYFYIIGGGFGNQKGLGIDKIGQYARLFGLSQKTDINLPNEAEGVIPSPAWKAKNFKGEPWRLGDTYHTSIGQYGVSVTPIQMARAYSAIANKGKLIQPTILAIKPEQAIVQASLPISAENFQIIHEGMRGVVLEGTASALNVPYLEVAAKTGTAELGVSKEKVNSWSVGFWPYQSPRYAFVVAMEKGDRSNLVGGVFVVRQLLDWMNLNTPEYLTSLPARP